MSGNDLSLSATGSVNANAGVTGPTAVGLREASPDSCFEQELRRQIEPGERPETAKARITTMATAAAADTSPESAATQRTTGNAPADWLDWLSEMRAHVETQPAERVNEPVVAALAEPVAEPVIETVIGPVATLAAPGTGELIAAAGSLAVPVTNPAGVSTKRSGREEVSEPIPSSARDSALLTPLLAASPALQTLPQPPAAPAIEIRIATPSATAAPESSSPPLSARAQPPLAVSERGELDAITARALAAAVPQLTPHRTAQTGGATALDRLPEPEPLGQALPATHAIAPGPERLPDSVPVQRHVATPMGQHGWDQAVSQQVSWLVRDQLQSASLSLNPPHLGPIQVTLQLDQQQATVQFVSAAPEVRQALQDALPALREMLSQAGIALGQADVDSRQPERNQPAFQRSNRRSGATDDESLEALVQPRAPGAGLLNLFA